MRALQPYSYSNLHFKLVIIVLHSPVLYMLWTPSVYAVVSKVTDQDAYWKKMNQILNIQGISSCRNEKVQHHLNQGFSVSFRPQPDLHARKIQSTLRPQVWEYSGACSFRHVNCQKFLIRAIIKELWRLFSIETRCLVAGYTHRIQMKNVFGRLSLHSNHWQSQRNLSVRHMMHKPKIH